MSMQGQKPMVVRSKIIDTMLEYLYEIVYNPLRNGFVRARDFGVEMYRNEVNVVMRHLEDITPMGGLDVTQYRERTSTGLAWYVEKSDVVGPISYPRITANTVKCNELRSRLDNGEYLKDVIDDMNLNKRRAKKHVSGECDCSVETPPLEYSRVLGWVTK